MRGQRGPEGGVGKVSAGNREARAGFTRSVPADAARSAGADSGAPDRARHGYAARGGDGKGAEQRRPGSRAVRRVRMRGARGDHRPLELGADRRGGEEDDRRRGQGAQAGPQGSGRPGGCEHLYHSKGWLRELSLESLGLKAVLPPPEERKHVKTAIGAARAEQERGKMR